MSLSLIGYPDQRLRRRSEEIEEVTEDVRERVREMFPVMYAAKGIGLAAPQVGWNVRLFVMNVAGEAGQGKEECFVNPEIVERDGRITAEEGCLSLPEIRGKVTRAKSIVFRAVTLDGEEVEIEATDLAARCVQHEIDHLDGVLIIDKVSPAERQVLAKKVRELEEKRETAKARV